MSSTDINRGRGLEVAPNLPRAHYGGIDLQRNAAFTLVELLVVIGLIAILIALLMPALARARESARSVACAAKIHQIGVASLAYASRNQGYLPVPVLGTNLMSGRPESAIWGTDRQGILDFGKGTLIPDLGGPSVAEELFNCPSEDEPRHVSQFYQTVYLRNFSYVFNEQLVDSYSQARGYKSRRITQFRCPARKAIVFENGDSPGLGCTPVGYPAMTHIPHLLIASRHHNRSNVFYADGHVDLFDSQILEDETVTQVLDNAAYVKFFYFDSD